MRTDTEFQRKLFIQTLSSIFEAAKLSTINRRYFIANEIDYQNVCLEQCVYRLTFPRHIGSSLMMMGLASEDGVKIINNKQFRSREENGFDQLFCLGNNADLKNLHEKIERDINNYSFVFAIDATHIEKETVDEILEKLIDTFLIFNKLVGNTTPNSLVFPAFIILN